MNSIPSPYENFIGMQVDEKKEGRAVIRLNKKEELTNFHGVFHGGVLSSLCDTASVQSLSTLDPAGPYYTVELSIRFKNPSQSDQIFAKSHSKHLRANLFLTDVRIVNEQDELIATAVVKSILPNFKK